jgi:hypothetical protein
VSGLWFLMTVLEAPCNSACTYLFKMQNQPAPLKSYSRNKTNI